MQSIYINNMPRAQRLRNVCFTDFDVAEDHRNTVHNYELAAYVITGIETCPSTGKLHLQGYAELREKVALTTLKELMPMAHFEQRKGTADAAIKYCKKEGNFLESGTRKAPGKRTDIERTKKIMQTGGGIRAVIEKSKGWQAISFALKAYPYYEKKRTEKPIVHWFWGPSGGGKTLTAFREAERHQAPFHIQKASCKWWQGYDGHEFVIIDEIRRNSQLDFVELLGLLDRYPHIVECKGGSRQFLAREIWITCPYTPEDCFRTSAEEIDQLLRRITEIRHFPKIPTDGPEVPGPEVGGNTRGPLGPNPDPGQVEENIIRMEPQELM